MVCGVGHSVCGLMHAMCVDYAWVECGFVYCVTTTRQGCLEEISRNLPVFGRVGVHSNTPWTLGEHLTAAGGDGGRVDFLRTVRGVVRNREGGRAARRGRRHFLQ